MSRIGKQPIEIPGGVNVSVAEGNVVTVTGPRGTLTQSLHTNMRIVLEDGVARVERPDEEGFNRALHGLTRTLLANMVEGVTKGYEKRLTIIGVGYRAALKGSDLEVQVGYSHPVLVPQPAGHRVRGPDGHLDRGARQRQGPGGRGRREHPQDPQARAVQGQGHPLRERVRPQEGGQGREGGRLMAAKTNRTARLRRHARVRKKVHGDPTRPRLAVYRSNRHIYAQLIDDAAASTVAAASDAEVTVDGSPTDRAKAVGQLLATRATEAGIRTAVFDRGGRRYHGRVAAVADGAREGGLQI